MSEEQAPKPRPIKPGEPTYFVVNLVAKLYQPSSGRVLVDGRDLAAVTSHSLHGRIASVTQEKFLFSGTVSDNIRLGKPGASDHEVREAVRALDVLDMIEELPQGFQSVVGERGKQLSTGERQRVALARALVADAAVLVLDEATGALDPSTESDIVDRLAELRRGRTTIVVTHRLDLARRADRVVVIEAGRIVEDGPPRRLESEGLAFRRLFAGAAAQ